MTAAELRERRRALGMTQTELARALGVAPRTVQHWEYGDRRIPEPVVRLLGALRSRRSDNA